MNLLTARGEQLEDDTFLELLEALGLLVEPVEGVRQGVGEEPFGFFLPFSRDGFGENRSPLVFERRHEMSRGD